MDPHGPGYVVSNIKFTWAHIRLVRFGGIINVGRVRFSGACSPPVAPALALVLPLHNPTRVPFPSKTQHHSTTPEAHPSSNSSEKLAGVDRTSNTESPARITARNSVRQRQTQAGERASERASAARESAVSISSTGESDDHSGRQLVTRVVTGPAVARHPSPRTALSLRK